MEQRTCSVAVCDKPVVARSLCGGHWRRARRGLDVASPLRPRIYGRRCSADGCTNKHLANGWCDAHLKRVQTTGTPGDQPLRKFTRGTPADRLNRKLDKSAGPDGCWPFMGAKTTLGYGRLGMGGGVVRQAHRIAYESLRGPIPAGLSLDHLCRNTSCCNPAHLEPVTPSENTRRMHASKRAVA